MQSTFMETRDGDESFGYRALLTCTCTCTRLFLCFMRPKPYFGDQTYSSRKGRRQVCDSVNKYSTVIPFWTCLKLDKFREVSQRVFMYL